MRFLEALTNKIIKFVFYYFRFLRVKREVGND